MSYPLPASTLTVGSGNPPADMDKVVNALVGMGEPGYIKPSGDTSGVTDTAAIATAEATGGPVYFDAATYYVTGLTKQAGTIGRGPAGT